MAAGQLRRRFGLLETEPPGGAAGPLPAAADERPTLPHFGFLGWGLFRFGISRFRAWKSLDFSRLARRRELGARADQPRAIKAELPPSSHIAISA